MLGDLRIGEPASDPLQRRQRALLIDAHQLRIAGDIGRHYGR
jgi:hypothetical protein